MSDQSRKTRLLPPNLQPLRAMDPRRLGAYDILGRLGVGGMGVAYLGDAGGELTVVKVIRTDADLDKSDLVRLERELDAMSRAASDRTVHLRDHDLSVDPPWFAMEFVPGPTLKDTVEQGAPLGRAALWALGRDLALAIADVHAAGVIHRDVKPSNIILSSPHARIIDFGIAAVDEGTRHTRTGSIVGTMGWVAPEQTYDQFSEATDVHAWGLCVYFAATGVSPFAASTPMATMSKVLHDTVKAPAGMSPALGALVESALAKEPNARPTIEALLRRLDQGDEPTLTDSGSERRPSQEKSRKGRWAVAAVLAVILGGAAGAATGAFFL